MDRFWEKVDKRHWKQCWVWLGEKTPNGYGKIGVGGKHGGWAYAHRFSYELFHELKLSSEEQVHHKCENKACVNPRHLELVTRLEHASEHLKDFCKHGHSFDDAYWSPTRHQRVCRACTKAKNRRAYLKRTAK